MQTNNLFADLPLHPEANERFITLLQQKKVRIEKIVSTGQCSPPDFWYDQAEHEWVVLLSGSATLAFAENSTCIDLQPGDFVDIPPHCKHRVTATSQSEPSVWLAVFVEAD